MMGGMVRRGILISILVFLAIAAARCDSKPGREGPVNPLDRENPITNGDPYGLDATYLTGQVSLKWNAINVPGIQGVTIFRRSQFDSLFARVDTVGGEEKTWIEDDPVYFATTWYRIAPIGEDGAEADTAGRGLDSISAPPFLEIAGGGDETAVREVSLFIGAAFADEMVLAEDTLFTGASWEPFDSAGTWTLSEGKGTKTVYLKVRRNGGETSGLVSGSIATASTKGALVLAGGDPTTARRWVPAAVSGSDLTRLVLSVDSLFGDAGDSVFVYDSLTTVKDTISWLFDTTLEAKVLYGEFSNEFGVDTVVVDSVWPDDFSGASVLLAGGAETTNECEVTLTVTADALYMMLSSDPSFSQAEWVPYAPNGTWEIGDTSGNYAVYARFENDFPAPQTTVTDDIGFEATPLAVLIDSPADSSYFAAGDSVSIRGGVIAASCRAVPDSLFVTVGDSLFAVALGDTISWASPHYYFTESPSETLAIDIVAAVRDETDSTATDTVTVFLVPASE